MVGETAVGLEELAAGDVCAERFQHLRRIKAPRTVAGIHHNVHAGQRLFLLCRTKRVTDPAAQPGGILRHVVGFLHATGRIARYKIPILRELQDLFDFRTFQAAGNTGIGYRAEKFQTVAVKGVVARRDLNRSVTAKIHRRHKHRRR